jgi:hypothetical protein
MIEYEIDLIPLAIPRVLAASSGLSNYLGIVTSRLSSPEIAS